MQLYYPMLTFTIGEPFQIENPYPSQTEGPVLATHSDGLHLILYSDSVETDLPIWGTETMTLGLTDFSNIPFLCLTFYNSPLTLLYTLNMYGMIGDERGPWLRSIGIRINILLVDNKTGQLACMRTVDTKLLAQLRHVCREQLKEYPDGEQIEITVQRLLDSQANEVTQQVTPQRVLHRAKLSNQVVIQYPASKPSEPESAK